MKHQPIGFLYILSLFCFLPITISAQESSEAESELPYYKRQIELLHDNDFLLFTDWYYTTGSFINYRILLNEASEDIEKRQLRFGISQLYYTPSNVLTTRIEDLDRPYAGYASINSSLSFISDKRILDFSMQLGVSGAISGAEGFQSWFHSTNDSNNPTWVGQIDDAVHANFYASYTRDWQLLPKPFGVFASWRPSLAMGTRDIYLQNEALFFFGKRQDMTQTMAFHQLGEIRPEFFFVIKFAYRYVMFDGLLEGNLIGDSSVYVINPIDHLFTYGIDGMYRNKRMEYKVGYNYSSPRAPLTSLHTWISISIARNF